MVTSGNSNISQPYSDVRSFEQFLDLFPATPRKKYKNGYYVLCLAHADKSPSLFIEPSKSPDFTVDFTCFANCKREDILKSVNLTWDNIRANHNNRHKTTDQPHREIEDYYKYVKNGKLVFEVVRTIPKGFYQRQPDGQGGYLMKKGDDGKEHYSMDGVEYCIYQYDEIQKAITKGDIIFIPEGEKDADSLYLKGLIATTNPMGAGPGKWTDYNYTQSLIGANVIVLQDNDKTGKEFALQKLNSLYGKVNSLKFVELTGVSDVIKDITDWFNAGHTTDDLLDLVKKAHEWTPDYETTKHLINMNDVVPVEVDWLWKPYIPIGKLTMIEGDPGEGKSTVTLAIATGLSKGAPIGTNSFPIGNTLLMSAEDGLADTIKPKLLKMEADCSKIIAIDELLSLDEQGLITLEKYIKVVKPILVIIDPIIAYTDKAMNMNQANQVRWLTARLAKLAEVYSLAVIAVRHLTKSNNNKAIYRGIASIDFTASARSVLLSGANEDTGEKALIHTKCNLALKGDSIGYRLVDNGLQWTGKSDMTYKDISSENGGALDDAKAWLEQILLDGDRESDFIFSEGKKLYNLSPATLKRAKKLLDINSYSKPELGKKGAGKWYWNLPGVEKND